VGTAPILVLVGYVAGSMPWGYWLVRAFRGEDVRTRGSGNIGGTNVWRVYGARLGFAVVFLDTAKGFVPALVATQVAGHTVGVLAGGAAMLGHWRPLFLRWRRGGKMVATCGGAFLGVAPLVGAAGAAIWILVFAVCRYASLASMISAATLPLWSWLLGYPWAVTVFAAVAAVGVVGLHRANIGRLLRGEETRLRLRRSGSSTSVSGHARS
jgi:glycerol-3-phosphate acyltransferase PlsY